ncbi:phage tail family protein [Bacillus subtilis]|uniref:phage tail domain-containing protein n=1 Tax=Bacillus subtilis TaxID=1423 RepID=UPI0027E0CFCA|nr:phage tail domain-containing protein [Bacillus subtilis]MDQ4711899.1 phage tail family protein [Bacillus subtilis]
MIRESQYFMFNNIPSYELGAVNVNTEGGLLEESFIANRTVNETYTRLSSEPYVDNVKLEPYEIPLNFYIENHLDEKNVRRVARWLNVDDYKPLSFSRNLDIIYFALPINATDLVHNCSNDGYVKLTMKVFPYKYGQETTTHWFDVTSGVKNIEIENIGDVDIPLSLEFKKIGYGDITVENLTLYRTPLKFTGIKHHEVINVDSNKKLITSSITGYECYDQVNEEYVILTRGKNRIKINGECYIRLKYRYKYL